MGQTAYGIAQLMDSRANIHHFLESIHKPPGPVQGKKVILSLVDITSFGFFSS